MKTLIDSAYARTSRIAAIRTAPTIASEPCSLLRARCPSYGHQRPGESPRGGAFRYETRSVGHFLSGGRLCYRAHMRTSELSRRTFLAMAAAVPCAASAGLRGARNVPVGLELYSVRGELAKDLLGTVAAVGKMGFQVVEFYAPYLDWTPATAKSVPMVLNYSGLKCHSSHNNGPSFTPDGMKKAIELNQIIGSQCVIRASAPRVTGIDGWKTVGDQLTALSEQLKPMRMATGYHNHQVEWRPVDGQRPMDVIAAHTPKDVVLQFDVGTCLEVGADPIAWIHANPGRISSVHCKD